MYLQIKLFLDCLGPEYGGNLLLRNVGDYQPTRARSQQTSTLRAYEYLCSSVFTSYVLRVILLSNSETMNPSGHPGQHTISTQHNSSGFYMQNAIKETRKIDLQAERTATKTPYRPSYSVKYFHLKRYSKKTDLPQENNISAIKITPLPPWCVADYTRHHFIIKLPCYYRIRRRDYSFYGITINCIATRRT